MDQRFFVSIFAPDEGALRKLNEYGLDLFRQTARRRGKQEASIDGLLNLQEVAKLVENGYQVLVKEDAEKSNRRPVPVMEFDDWLKTVKGEEPK